MSVLNPLRHSICTLSFPYIPRFFPCRMEPYWVENADELIFVQQGVALEITKSEKYKDCRDSFTVEKEFFAIHEQGSLWTIENKGNDTAKLYRFFNHNNPKMNTLYDWYTNLPEDVRKSVFYPEEQN